MTGAPSRGATGREGDACCRCRRTRSQSAALRRADTTRAVSAFTSESDRGGARRACNRVVPDLQRPLGLRRAPGRPAARAPTALFVGMLEAYKNIDGLAAAWRRGRGAATGRPARDRRQGQPAARRRRAAARSSRTASSTVAELSPAEVAAALDRSTLLVLPSWPEGLGRVVIEAFARGRGVVVTAAGGVLDLVDDGVEGILDSARRRSALVAASHSRPHRSTLAERLGAAAHVRYADWHSTPERFARQLRELVDQTVARSRS